jgi:hypothetical protein
VLRNDLNLMKWLQEGTDLYIEIYPQFPSSKSPLVLPSLPILKREGDSACKIQTLLDSLEQAIEICSEIHLSSQNIHISVEELTDSSDFIARLYRLCVLRDHSCLTLAVPSAADGLVFSSGDEFTIVGSLGARIGDHIVCFCTHLLCRISSEGTVLKDTIDLLDPLVLINDDEASMSDFWHKVYEERNKVAEELSAQGRKVYIFEIE